MTLPHRSVPQPRDQGSLVKYIERVTVISVKCILLGGITTITLSSLLNCSPCDALKRLPFVRKMNSNVTVQGPVRPYAKKNRPPLLVISNNFIPEYIEWAEFIVDALQDPKYLHWRQECVRAVAAAIYRRLQALALWPAHDPYCGMCLLNPCGSARYGGYSSQSISWSGSLTHF